MKKQDNINSEGFPEISSFYVSENPIDFHINLNNYFAYKIGVLHLTHIISHSDLGDELYEQLQYKDSKVVIPYHNINAYSFSDIPDSIDTSHDGSNLYYQRECSHCNKQYESYIWGD